MMTKVMWGQRVPSRDVFCLRLPVDRQLFVVENLAKDILEARIEVAHDGVSSGW
jgi:hypothetical protein